MRVLFIEYKHLTLSKKIYGKTLQMMHDQVPSWMRRTCCGWKPSSNSLGTQTRFAENQKISLLKTEP